MEPLVDERAPVFGHDVLSLLQRMGGKASAEALRNAAAGAFGVDAVYANCHGDRFSFDEVLAFLASKGKLERRGDHVFLGSVPGCSGH
jgi:probable metal-binding protein